jgi:hypothetical protein
MQILKTFIDSTGHRHKVGADAPKEWDKATLAHYQHHGMVSAGEGTGKAPSKTQKPAGPIQKKPAGPSQTKAPGADASGATDPVGGDGQGSENNTTTTNTGADAGGTDAGSAAGE